MEQATAEFSLLVAAEGSIAASEQQQERLDELTERVASGEFHTPVTDTIPCKCIDGRSAAQPTVGPNSSGGTGTLLVADDLTAKRFAAEDGSLAGALQNLIDALQTAGLPVGGHSDTGHTDPQLSGCGAHDKMELIYTTVTEKSEVIKELAEAILGADNVDDDAARHIVECARDRSSFSPGHDILNVLEQAGGSRVEALEGSHREVVCTINFKYQTTLDRAALATEFGPNYQAFNVDAWSFQAAAEAIAVSETEVSAKILAMTYYNVATALVLCGPQMRLCIVR